MVTYIDFTEEEQKLLWTLPFDNKPVLYVANADEDQVANPGMILIMWSNSWVCSDCNAEVVIPARVEKKFLRVGWWR